MTDKITAKRKRDLGERIEGVRALYHGVVCDTKEDFVTDILADLRHYCDLNNHRPILVDPAVNVNR